MSDEGSAQPVAAPTAEANSAADGATVDTKVPDAPVSAAAEANAEAPNPAGDKANTEAAEPAKEDEASKQAEDSSKAPAEKPAEDGDVEMKDAPDATNSPPAEGAPTEDKTEHAAAGEDASAAATKTKTPARRKSTAGADSAKGKKLNKKGSRAAITHIDAQPGQHFFIKLKGYPQWPCIICDEDMLPHALIKTRPVSAMRTDGTYREDFADGGKRAADRTFPIMYLATNEFGWVSNKDLVDLDSDKVSDLITPKMRKDLQLAHEIAAEGHNLEYYKDLLQQFQEELIEKQKAAEAKAAAAATPKKSKKQAKSSADVEDVEMEDVDDEPPTTKAKKSEKKRKNTEDSETPQRSESVKKPKIKLTNNATPKTANGATPKSAKAGGEAKTKKAKKPAKEADEEEKAQSPKEPEMSAEDRFERKKKEVLFLRHKLQKGLLTRDQLPKEDEVKVLSDYLVKLEQFPDLETEIIRATKINKVLKAMLKLDSIPKEEEFNFKPRSQALLEKWNKLLQEEGPTSAAPEETNGVNGHSEAPVKEEAKTGANGVAKAETEDSETKAEAPEESKAEVKEQGKKDTQEDEKEEAAPEEKPATEENAKSSAAVEATA
ncbi:hypothetical protein KVR01_005167 [Diaporthe batatas]|uniref:uncharacterized protein n=1 Tax=Diaporthe batatas TaxID=748121 RepID=UPI001D04E52B|nr:uncharacterized protein KVR01_005167 [Diaporthe batatas]KAG8164892.1 hypothetical protein KVR01_005167 [Diaporthe batatas]